MYYKHFFLTVVAVFMVGDGTARAVVFPNEIQTCVSGGTCTLPMLVQQAEGFAAYFYMDGGTSKYLLEYELWPLSNESTNFTTTELSGSAWLSANETYDLAEERHLFTLYLDQVSPTPTNLWLGDSDGLDVGLSLITEDLLAGSGYFRMGDGGLVGGLGTHGGSGPILMGHSFVPCLASTCEVGAGLNLLKLQYTDIGSVALLSLNLADERAVLYSQFQDYAYDDTWYVSQTYYNNIPEPASVSLLVLAICALGLRRHHRGL